MCNLESWSTRELNLGLTTESVSGDDKKVILLEKPGVGMANNEQEGDHNEEFHYSIKLLFIINLGVSRQNAYFCALHHPHTAKALFSDKYKNSDYIYFFGLVGSLVGFPIPTLLVLFNAS